MAWYRQRPMTADTNVSATATEPAAAGEADLAVSVRGLVKRYGDVTAVDGIDLDVRRGRCLGVLGPNGAGKTTTIEILEGLKQPDAGEVKVLGRSWATDRRWLQERIGVQLQETDLQEKLGVYETLRLFASFFERTRSIDEVLDLIDLREKKDAWVKNLSGGQRQRLNVGCALLNQPEVLFLDEPTTGLDPQARRMLWEVVERFKEGGGTVLLTTHYMEEAERLADDLVVVDRGRIIAEGAPAELIASLGAESLVSITVEGGADAVSDDALTALDGVDSVRREGDAIVLVVTDTKTAIAEVFGSAAASGIVIEDLRTHRPTLEDVFIAMTGKTLRDD